MSSFSEDLIQALTDAVKYSRRNKVGSRTHFVGRLDVRALRRKLGLSQLEFAGTYHIPLPTLKNWEQGRREPDAPALAYLRAIARQPEVIKDSLAG